MLIINFFVNWLRFGKHWDFPRIRQSFSGKWDPRKRSDYVSLEINNNDDCRIALEKSLLSTISSNLPLQNSSYKPFIVFWLDANGSLQAEMATSHATKIYLFLFLPSGRDCAGRVSFSLPPFLPCVPWHWWSQFLKSSGYLCPILIILSMASN